MNYPYRNPRVLTDIAQPAPDSRLILNHETGRYLRLGLREFDWLTRLNGQVHVRDIATELGEDESLVEELLRRFESAKLICFSEDPVTLLPVQPVSEAKLETRRVEWTHFGQLRIHLTQPKALLDRLSPITRRLMSRPFVTVGIFLSLAGLILGATQGRELGRALQDFQWSVWQALAIVALLFATTIVHEFGHAVACDYFGAPVRSLGIMIYYLQPAAYADVTDSWQLANRWHRVAISSAGIYVQAIITSLSVGLWMVLRLMGRSSDLVAVFILLNVTMMAFNIIPFVKLDGYWILSNMLGVANLRDRAMEWVRASLASVVTRRPVDGQHLRYNAVLAMPPLDRILLACFGFTSIVFGTAMWIGGLGFLFRVTRWLGLPRMGSFLAVGGLLLALGIAFLVRLLLARRRARRPQPVVAERSRQAISTVVRYDIDQQRPIRLNPNVAAMEEEDGAVTFAYSTPNALTLQVPERFFDNLPMLREGSVTLHELQQSELWCQEFERVLQRLWHEKHLRYASDWEVREENERYSRQLGWFSMNAAARGKETEALARLQAASVVILGVGGLGTHVAWNLAACGVGTLHLVDGDTIELTNLNRQLFFTPADVGKKKIDIAAERLLDFNPQLRIRKSYKFVGNVEEVMDVIEGSSFVVRAIDTPDEALAMVNEACVRQGIPYLGGGFFPQGTIVGPMVIPGESSCLACAQSGTAPRIDRGAGGTIAPLVTSTASLLSAEVVTYLGKLGPVKTVGRMLSIDAPTLGFGFIDVPRNERCPICGQQEERRASA